MVAAALQTLQNRRCNRYIDSIVRVHTIRHFGELLLIEQLCIVFACIEAGSK